MKPPLERFQIWGRLAAHRRAVEVARRAVSEWLAVVLNPYVAFSGGKDSTCTLALVREQAPDIPAVYFDADCAFPEISTLLDATPNLIRFPADEPFLVTLKRHGVSGDAVERATMETTVYGPIRRLLAQYCFDGVAYGLRAEESRGRKMNAIMRGPVFRYKRDGLMACQPVCHWAYNDVWAYIFARGLPYAGVYDRMWDAPEDDQRVSYWAGETKRRWGRYAWLKHNYPELWNRLAAELPEVRAYA